MLTFSPQGLYLSAPSDAPPGTKALPVVGLAVDEGTYAVNAALVLDESGRISYVTAGLAGRKFKLQA